MPRSGDVYQPTKQLTCCRVYKIGNDMQWYIPFANWYHPISSHTRRSFCCLRKPHNIVYHCSPITMLNRKLPIYIYYIMNFGSYIIYTHIYIYTRCNGIVILYCKTYISPWRSHYDIPIVVPIYIPWITTTNLY